MMEVDHDPMDAPSRVVTSNGSIVGIVWFEQLDAHAGSVDEVMERLSPGDFLSADTTILDAVEIFCGRPNYYFYLLDKNDVIGVMFFNDLFKPLARLAYLALALEIEQLALNLCQLLQTRAKCWEAFPEARKRKTLEAYEQIFGRPAEQHPGKLPIKALIACTNLIDKATMIWKCKLIPTKSRKEVLSFFHSLKEVRDHCAHPGREQELLNLLPRERLKEFVEKANDIRIALSESIEKYSNEPVRIFLGDPSNLDV